MDWRGRTREGWNWTPFFSTCQQPKQNLASRFLIFLENSFSKLFWTFLFFYYLAHNLFLFWFEGLFENKLIRLSLVRHSTPSKQTKLSEPFKTSFMPNWWTKILIPQLICCLMNFVLPAPPIALFWTWSH